MQEEVLCPQDYGETAGIMPCGVICPCPLQRSFQAGSAFEEAEKQLTKTVRVRADPVGVPAKAGI